MKYLIVAALSILLISCKATPPSASKETVMRRKSISETPETQNKELEKVECEERDSSVKNSADPLIIKQCTFLDYRTITIGEADYKGRYSYRYKLQRKNKKGFERIENTSLFLKQTELLDLLNERLSSAYSSIKNDPETADCLEGEDLLPSANSLNDFQIEFTDNAIRFNYSFGLSGACFNVDGVIIDVKLSEIRTFSRK